LLPGYLAPGHLTVLTGHVRSGTSTLLSVLLARLKTGGLLAGLPVAAGKAIVLTEEPAERWTSRARTLDFGDHVGWYCRPFAPGPTHEQWLTLVEAVAESHARHGWHLVAVDSLAYFLPAWAERSAAPVRDFLLPLRRLTGLGLCVLLVCPVYLAGRAADLFPRGRSAPSPTGLADIMMEQRWYRRVFDGDRRRRLLASSPYPQTPRQLVIELNAAGTDYRGHGAFLAQELAAPWTILRTLLAGAPHSLTRRQLAGRWPTPAAAPAPVTLWRWLEQAVGQGLLLREGTGSKRDPYRYGLPGQAKP
jgi:hypothetical protein